MCHVEPLGKSTPRARGVKRTMMMIGRGISHLNPTVHVPPWSPFDDPTAISAAPPSSPLPVSGVAASADGLVLDKASLAALQLYLGRDDDEDPSAEDALPVVDAYASDEFRMFEFKVRRCARGRAHDWTDCPFAHPGEKARRRDPRKHRYSGAPCPDFRKVGGCKRGDACELAHGVFECWLHPDRYRTQPCKDGTDCRRRVCFFAHTPDQLRLLPPPPLQQTPSAAVIDSYDGSPLRQQSAALQSYLSKNLNASPTSTLISPPKSPPTDSPPISPSSGWLRRASWPASSSVNEIVASLRQLQLNRAESMPSSWGLQHMANGGFASPRGVLAGFNAGFCSLPATPTGAATGWPEEEELAERVESGWALRAKMFERLSKDSIFDRAEAAPDVEWVSELLK